MGNNQAKNKTEEEKYEVLEPSKEVREKAYKLEREILGKSGLKLDEEVWVDDIQIDHFGLNYLHTLRCGRPEHEIQDHMIIIHGYQGSSITFYKLFQHLYPKYNIYCPDIIGMALSSRPKVNFKTTQEWLNFFVDSFEKMREVLKIDKFHLIGHSLGGYFSGLYALKYPHRVIKLTLLSPAGITDISKGGSINERMPFGKKVGFFMLGLVWGMKLTMQDTYLNPMTRITMRQPLRKRYMVDKEENELLAQLTECAFEYPQDVDKAIYYIFKNPIPNVHSPLEDRLFEEVKDFKVDIYFGESDWMDQAGSVRLCQKDSKRFKMFTISQSGHNFNLENPEELSKHLLENHRIEDFSLTFKDLNVDQPIEMQFINDESSENEKEIK
jgi:abhydrolase domain-containing protein 5